MSVAEANPRPRPRVGLLGWTLRALACAYPIALLAVIAAFRLIGERWWPVVVALYLPRIGFVLPLPILALALALRGPRRLLIAQLVAALLILFPLMGLHLSRAAAPGPGAPRLRVVSCNVNSGRMGTDAIVAVLAATDADIIVLQEVAVGQHDALRAALPGYRQVELGQFWLFSRLPIEETFKPPSIIYEGGQRTAHFVRYRIATPQGPIHVYNMHPVSPSQALQDLRGDGLLQEMSHGRLGRDGEGAAMALNAALRVAQARALAEDAARSPLPVLIAGDTNLPELSWGFARWLGGYRDGFAETGTGFGYTFPTTKRPWMRIDRILADRSFRFLRFSVIDALISDHRAVMADVEPPPAPTPR